MAHCRRPAACGWLTRPIDLLTRNSGDWKRNTKWQSQMKPSRNPRLTAQSLLNMNHSQHVDRRPRAWLSEPPMNISTSNTARAASTALRLDVFAAGISNHRGDAGNGPARRTYQGIGSQSYARHRAPELSLRSASGYMGGLTGAFSSANISAERFQEELRREAMLKANGGLNPHYVRPPSRTPDSLVNSPHTPTHKSLEGDTSTPIAAQMPVNHCFETDNDDTTIRRGNSSLHLATQSLAFNRPLSEPATMCRINPTTGMAGHSEIQDAEVSRSSHRGQTGNEETVQTASPNEQCIFAVLPNVEVPLLSPFRIQRFQIPLPVDTDKEFKIDIMVSDGIGYHLSSGLCNKTGLYVTRGVAQVVANATMSLKGIIENNRLYIQRVLFASERVRIRPSCYKLINPHKFTLGHLISLLQSMQSHQWYSRVKAGERNLRYLLGGDDDLPQGTVLQFSDLCATAIRRRLVKPNGPMWCYFLQLEVRIP
ncbi:hypothetical protein C8Q73DRAFT_715906 [Cubamyces lactineus]|nr:hypothetical protein C8Q73DRAFT_715906 [Cubamyces lactineus]